MPQAPIIPEAMTVADSVLLGRNPHISPLGVEGTAWDVGWAAVYLASDEARWVTGQTLVVDGGVTLTSR